MGDEKSGGGDKVVELRPGKGRRRRPSTIDLLPKDIKDALNDAIAEGTMSVDALWGLVKERGGSVSRSAVGRHKVQEERALEGLMLAQRTAATVARESAKDPNGNVSKLLTQLVQSVAFQRIMAMTPAQIEKLDPKDLNFLAGMAKSTAQSDKITAEREAMIRDRAIKQERAALEKKLATAEKKGDMDKEAAQKARRILGFAE